MFLEKRFLKQVIGRKVKLSVKKIFGRNLWGRATPMSSPIPQHTHTHTYTYTQTHTHLLWMRHIIFNFYVINLY